MTDYDDRLEAYAETAAAALPPGAFWQGFRDYDGTGRELLRAKAQTWLDVDLAAERLIAESQPARAFEMLSDHETQVGLPDSCFQTLNVNIETRRNTVLTRYRAQGGQSPKYFIDLANSLGYDVTVTERRPFVCGLSKIGGDSGGAAPVTRIDSIGADRFSWRVVVPEPRVTWFRCGSGVLGQDTLATIIRAGDLECLLARYQPAHQVLAVSYQGLREPVLSVWAVPGLPLPAPFVFSRPEKGIGFNTAGQYTMVESGILRDHFDPETYEYKGKLILPSFRNSCLNYNAAPTDSTGIQGPYGDENAVLSVVNDTEELGKVHVLKQLLREGTLNGNVFKLDNSLGTKSTYVTVAGNTSSPGSISTISTWCRTDNGGVIDMAGGFGGKTFANTSYARIHKTVDMPDGVLAQLAVVADPGATVWFILNQCEVGASPSFVPVITQGVAYVTASDVLTIGPVETGNTVFDVDFTKSISGFYPKNDCLVSQDETHGLIVSSPTTGAVIAGIDVPVSWQGKRFRLLFHADNGYLRSFYFIAAGGVSLGVRQINPGYAGDITIPYGTLQLHLRADGVPSNTSVYWKDLKLTELVPFEGWDSSADGHTVLLDTDTPLSGYSAVPGLVDLSDGTNDNLYHIYQSANNGQMGASAKANGGSSTSTIVPNVGATDVLSAFQFNTTTLRLTKTGATDIAELVPSVMPAGICYIKFGTVTLKRFAVFDRYLPDSVVQALVRK